MKPNDPEEFLEIVDRRRPATSWVKYASFALVGVVFVVCGYRLLLHFTPREIASAATTPLEKGVTLTGKFLSYAGNFLTSSHTSTQSELEVGRVTAADKSGPLLVAKQDLLLKFTTVNERIFGTSSAEVRAKGQAFYFVPLLGPGADWRIEAFEKDGVRACVVHAPRLRVLTPINLDTRSIEIATSTGVLRTNTQEMTEAALADITPRLNRAAMDQAVNARDAARKTIAAFVKAWLLQSDSWGAQHLNAIQVVFPDETAGDANFTVPGFYERK